LEKTPEDYGVDVTPRLSIVKKTEETSTSKRAKSFGFRL